MRSGLLLRMRDVALCLFYAKKNNQLLTKIQLQKLIYLSDCLQMFMSISLLDKGHETYFHGPYDRNIQNASDILVFRNMAEMHNVHFFGGNISCQYELIESGENWVEYLRENDQTALRVSSIIECLLEVLIKRDLLKEIKNIAYSEPLFVKNQKNGYGVTLDFNDLDENDVFNYLTIVLDAFEFEKETSKMMFVSDLFIDYLQKRMKALATNQEV